MAGVVLSEGTTIRSFHDHLLQYFPNIVSDNFLAFRSRVDAVGLVQSRDTGHVFQ